jgi:hypothetical protein
MNIKPKGLPVCLPCSRRQATLTSLHPKHPETVQLNQKKSVRIIREATPPQQTLRFPFHQLQQNRSKIPHRPHKRTLHIAPVRYWHPRPRTSRPTNSTLWQSNKPLQFQCLQKLSTLPSLQRTIRPAPGEQLAHRPSQLHPTQPRTLRHYLPNQRQLLPYKSATAKTLPSTTHHIHQTKHPFPVSYI